MPNEALIAEIESMLSEIIRLGGENERSQMVPNLTVQSINPGKTGFILVSDSRDGDNILAKTVPGVVYNINDTVNVMFIKGGEAIAFQQGSQSSSSNIWGIVPSTTTDIYYNSGDVGIGKAVAPDARLESLDTVQAQLRLTFQEDTKFADFTVDTNHDLTITPSSTGQIILQPTTDSIDFFQVLDADGGVPILNVDSTNEGVGIKTTSTNYTFQGAATQVDLFIEGSDVGGVRSIAVERQSDTAARGPQNAFLRSRASAAAAQNGDVVGTFNFEAHDGTDYNLACQFQAQVDGAVSANTVPMAFIIKTSPNASGGLVDRFHVSSTGDIGIGKAAPTRAVDIYRASGNTAFFLEIGDGSDASFQLKNTTAQWNTRNSGGDYQIREVLPATSTWLTVQSTTGYFGFNRTAPEGQLHGYDVISGIIKWEYDGLDGTSRTIIANGAGDVLYRLTGMYVLRDSAGARASGTMDINNSTSQALTVGGNTVTVAVAASGATTVSRTAGTDTIKVTFLILWL